jgi:hypothetical protein
MELLQRCGQDGCLEWVEREGPELPIVFCSPAHARAWERSHASLLTSAHRCQWCWELLGQHSSACPVGA